ncbi:MAG: hypothetical protein U0235_28355 [Polyangiaceae bacterium]
MKKAGKIETSWDSEEFLSDVRSQLEDLRDVWTEHERPLGDLTQAIQMQMRLWEDSVKR